MLGSLVFAAITAGAVGAKIFQVPQRYQLDLTFQIPYYNISQEVYVWADENVMRMSYFGGANVFIFNNQTAPGFSVQVTPAESQLGCNKNPLDGFQAVFPALDLFQFAGTESVNGRMVDKFTFSFIDPTTTSSGSMYNPPNNVGAGYAGTYAWYQDTNTAIPVMFHILAGHNVVFGGSHYDEYIVTYNMFVPDIPTPANFFDAPIGMPCPSGISPFGPTVDAKKMSGADVAALKKQWKTHGAAAPTDFLAMFPEGHERRHGLARQHEHVFQHLLDQPHDTKATIRVNSAAHFVSARNKELAAKGRKYTVGINHFAHMTHEERKAMSSGFRTTAHLSKEEDVKDGQWPLGPGLPMDSCTDHVMIGGDLPDTVDLVAQNLVNPPKDQGTCGSCWSFGAIGAIEGAVAKALNNGQLPPRLSQQNLMDCSWAYGNNACNGGNDYAAYSFLIQQNRGFVASEASYGPYLNHNGFCHFDLSKNWTTSPSTGAASPGARLTACYHITNQWNKTNPTMPVAAQNAALNDVLAHVGKPVSVAIQATLPDFYFYTGGYYYDDQCHEDTGDLDHQVLATGYTTVNGTKYTHIKNSWSDHWGEGGYVWISQDGNDCGVATSGTYIDAIAV